MKTIVAAIDFSPVTESVVAEAATLARALGGKVLLVTVLVEQIYLTEYAPPQKSIAKITVTQGQAVRRRLAAIASRLRSDHVPTASILRRGHAAGQIVAVAAENDTALIVIGSHGHHAFFELVLGSTTQAVLKRARQPVVVIPPGMPKPRRKKAPVRPAPAHD